MRGPTRKAASATPEMARFEFLTEAASYLNGTVSSVATHLGQRALQVRGLGGRGGESSGCSGRWRIQRRWRLTHTRLLLLLLPPSSSRLPTPVCGRSAATGATTHGAARLRALRHAHHARRLQQRPGGAAQRRRQRAPLKGPAQEGGRAAAQPGGGRADVQGACGWRCFGLGVQSLGVQSPVVAAVPAIALNTTLLPLCARPLPLINQPTSCRPPNHPPIPSTQTCDNSSVTPFLTAAAALQAMERAGHGAVPVLEAAASRRQRRAIRQQQQQQQQQHGEGPPEQQHVQQQQAGAAAAAAAGGDQPVKPAAGMKRSREV